MRWVIVGVIPTHSSNPKSKRKELISMIIETFLPDIFSKDVVVTMLYKTESMVEFVDDNHAIVHIFVVHESLISLLKEEPNAEYVQYKNMQIVLLNGTFYLTFEEMKSVVLSSSSERDNQIKIEQQFSKKVNDMDLFYAIAKVLKLSDDQISELKTLILKQNEDANIELAIQTFTQDYVKDMEQITKQIQKYNKDNTTYKQIIQANNTKIATLMENYSTFNKEGFMDKVRVQFYKIAQHPKVTVVGVEDGYFVIHTVDLYMYEPINKKRYYLGKMKIFLPFVFDEQHYIKFGNINNSRNGFWTSAPHPHCSSNGWACFGNIDIQLLELYAKFQYYDIFMLLLNYLQTANIEDSAGKSITAWDVVDEEGNVIEEGHDYKQNEVAPEIVDEYEAIPVPEGLVQMTEEIAGATEVMRGTINPFGLEWLDTAIQTMMGVENNDNLQTEQ
jgi:hypothetical protein